MPNEKVEEESSALLMLDKELAARVFNPPVWLVI